MEGIYVQPRISPTTDPNSMKQFARTAAFGTAGLVISPKLGRLYQGSLVNSSATRYFVQLHDKATAPVATESPIWEADLPANGGCPFYFGAIGLYFANGISVAISTTKGVLTLAAATDATAYAIFSAKT